MDNRTIAEIKRKNNVHGPIFRKHGFSWRLKFRPEFSEGPGNYIGFLDLLSYPRPISSVDAAIDSLAAAIETVQKQMISIQNQMDEDKKENKDDVQYQIDGIKMTLQELTVKSDVAEEDKEEALFKKWVVNTLKYQEYYELFVENGVDTLNVAKLLTKRELKAIGINKIGHQLKIMDEIQALKRNEINHRHRHINNRWKKAL